MTPLMYHCPTAPDNRRWIAQYPRASDNLYITVHGPTADIARAKLMLMWQHATMDPKDRKAFDLKGKLAALAVDEEEDELL